MIYEHPKFDNDHRMDAALINIRKAFNPSKRVQAIGLGSSKGVKVWDECTVMGWGNTAIDWDTKYQTEMSTFLKAGKLNITDIRTLNIYFRNLKRDGCMSSPYMLKGDSGSPLFCHDRNEPAKQKLFGWYQGGFIGEDEGQDHSSYVNLKYFKKWILETLKLMEYMDDEDEKEKNKNFPVFSA